MKVQKLYVQRSSRWTLQNLSVNESHLCWCIIWLFIIGEEIKPSLVLHAIACEILANSNSDKFKRQEVDQFKSARCTWAADFRLRIPADKAMYKRSWEVERQPTNSSLLGIVVFQVRCPNLSARSFRVVVDASSVRFLNELGLIPFATLRVRRP